MQSWTNFEVDPFKENRKGQVNVYFLTIYIYLFINKPFCEAPLQFRTL